MSEGGKKAVASDDEVVSTSEVRALKKQVRELERLLSATAPMSPFDDQAMEPFRDHLMEPIQL